MNKRFCFFATFICLITMSLLTPTKATAQLNWRFEFGGMYQGVTNGDYEDIFSSYEKSYLANAGLFLQIPINKKENPYFIETGLNFLAKNALSVREGATKPYWYDDVIFKDWNYYLQLPVKFGWRKHLKGRNWLELGVGPYVSYAFDDMGYNNFQVGITPSVVFRHRCISVGFSYQNPIFYNGTHDCQRNTVMFSFGLNFGNKAWKWIGLGVATAATVGGAVATAYGQTHQSSAYSSSSSYSDSNNTSTSRSKSSSSSNKNTHSASEMTNRNAERNVYDRYDTMITQHFTGVRPASISDVREWQSKMKQLRQKWEKRGLGWQALPNETR